MEIRLLYKVNSVQWQFLFHAELPAMMYIANSNSSSNKLWNTSSHLLWIYTSLAPDTCTHIRELQLLIIIKGIDFHSYSVMRWKWLWHASKYIPSQDWNKRSSLLSGYESSNRILSFDHWWNNPPNLVMSIDIFLSTSHYKERKHNNSFCVCNYCAHNAIICTAELYLTDTLPTGGFTGYMGKHCTSN